MRPAYVVAMAGIFFLPPMTLTGEVNPTVILSGLQVVGRGYGSNGTELQAFNQPSGVTLALVIRAPENKKIVDVVDSKCILEKFTDDRGNNLLDNVDWDGFPKISKDGRYALIEVTSKGRPSPDASRLLAVGTIHCRMAASERTEVIENLKLEVGVKAKIRQEIIEVMKVQADDEGLNLVLQISRKLKNEMKDIRFYSVEGESVDLWGQGAFSFGNASQMEYHLDLKSIPESLRIEIDVWQETEIMNLPFEIESGLGFQE
ncbi:hypothetical protein JW906_12145 [bacterium]|nr:hypothetical protein [bacterium]